MTRLTWRTKYYIGSLKSSSDISANELFDLLDDRFERYGLGDRSVTQGYVHASYKVPGKSNLNPPDGWETDGPAPSIDIHVNDKGDAVIVMTSSDYVYPEDYSEARIRGVVLTVENVLKRGRSVSDTSVEDDGDTMSFSFSYEGNASSFDAVEAVVFDLARMFAFVWDEVKLVDEMGII